jgi:hypothetical protein
MNFDMRKVEIQIWADFLRDQENPIFQDVATFLDCHLDEGGNFDNPKKHLFRELLKSEIESAYKLAEFFSHHSNDLLLETAEWLPEWVESH